MCGLQSGSFISTSTFAFSWRYLDPFTFLSWPSFHWPQSIGLLAGVMLGGHDAATARIAAITIPVNAIISMASLFSA
jgi:hypothetical protein